MTHYVIFSLINLFLSSVMLTVFKITDTCYMGGDISPGVLFALAW